MERIRLRLANNSYDVLIGSGILSQMGSRLKENGFSGSLVIITNPIVNRHYGASLQRNLTEEGFSVTTLLVPDGEVQKSLHTAGKLYQQLANSYAERTTPILALGGGVIGDLAGFVAATYMRGIPLVQIPTTLLAQVDSSIGGKVAVDHEQLKNEIGAFYQPRLVITDIDTLKTLDSKTFRDGLAEVIKYGVIRDKKFFNYLETNLAKIIAFDETVLEKVVYWSVEIKARVVEKDEKDLGLRSILNFGHTIGHAIETVSNFGIVHAEAVAIGMIIAARISAQLGTFDRDELARLENLIKAAGLPTKIPNLEAKQLIQAMQHDKKVRQGRLRLVLPKRLGEVFIIDQVELPLVEQILVEGNETA
ncbi:MAG: 3-dehydroquinate synthase [Dehalococcoidales bacterium]|nr:3-dehydroquinate synthase [Dehalococcoidales bacterium]